MKIVVLAAGYGTRLYPLTYHLAKPLIPINKKPIINFLFDKIKFLEKKFPVDEIRVVVNKKFYKDFLSWKKRFKIKAKILNDGSLCPEDRLGTIKDMKFAFRSTNADWLVLGGDNLFDDNLIGFLKFAKKHSPHCSIGLYDVGSKSEAKRFGIVVLNKDFRIVSFQEKPKKPASTLAASCIYFFPRQSLRLLNEFVLKNPNIDASGRYIAWLAKKSKVFGYRLSGHWMDIGHFHSLKLAEKLFN